ncbi:hypothetical protein SLE2022_175360 [Rubroshorea leprosula]
MMGVNSRSSSSYCPSPSHFSSPRVIDNGGFQNILNVSPRSSSQSNPTLHLDRSLADQASLYPDSCKRIGYGSIESVPSNMSSEKSSLELRKEIATLELEILHLERYLLSLYRTAFEEHLPILSNTSGSPLKSMSESSLSMEANRLHHNLQAPVEILVHHDKPSPSHESSISDSQSCSSSFNKAKSIRDQKNPYSRHQSLADHLGASLIDNKFYTPDKLSEDIVRCISSIYCKFASVPRANAGLPASPISSLSSSSIFSSKNPCDSWSPLCNEEEAANNHGLKEESGLHAAAIEVLKICLDDDSFNFAAVMLQNFRSLVRNLEKVDPRKMKREEKLAFWINIHNALVMHAYLAYGTTNHVKTASLMKAAYNVGGQYINAYIIQTSILGIRSHYSAPWLQTLFSPGRKSKTASYKHAYAFEYPEPLVHFALCSGTFSDPMVRVYTSKNIFKDLKVAKEEFIQASVYIHKETKIYLPKIVYYYAKDMSLDVCDTLEVVSECLPEVQQKAIQKCMKGRPDRHIHWLPQSSNFRYVFQGELAEQRPNA